MKDWQFSITLPSFSSFTSLVIIITAICCCQHSTVINTSSIPAVTSSASVTIKTAITAITAGSSKIFTHICRIQMYYSVICDTPSVTAIPTIPAGSKNWVIGSISSSPGMI